MMGQHWVNNSQLITALGYTLFHSLWQIAVLWIFSVAADRVLRDHSPNMRYLIKISIIAVIPVAAILCFWEHYQQLIRQIHIPIQASFQGQLSADYPDITGLPPWYMSLAVLIWCSGMSFVSLRFTGGFLYLWRLKNQYSKPMEAKWQAVLDSLKSKLNLKKRVGLLESIRVQTPMMAGLLKPVILVPAGLFTGFPPAQIEAILLHELAHIQRNDYIVNIFQTILEIVFFYHPCIWMMSHAIRDERERCCDDIVVNVSGDSLSYAHALLNLGSQNICQPALAMPVTGKNKNLLNRVKRMMEGPKMRPYLMERLFAVGLVMTGVILVTGFSGGVFADESEPQIKVIEMEGEGEMMQKEIIIKKIGKDGELPEDLAGLGIPEDMEGQSRLEITLKDGEVVKILKDGVEVPESEYEDYAQTITEMEQLVKENTPADCQGDGKIVEMIRIGDPEPMDEAASGEKIKKIVCIKKTVETPDDN